MTKIPFSDLLSQGVLVFDGPMGTELYRRHVFTNRCFDELNLSEPTLIKAVLSDYAEAGADVLTTNSYGANRFVLEKYGFADKLAAINLAAAKIAREVADAGGAPTAVGGSLNSRRLFVAGSIGPVVQGTYTEIERETMILEQVDPLVEGGVDFIIFETLPSRECLERAAKMMAKRPDVSFVLSVAVLDEKESISGEPIARLFAKLPDYCATPTALGLNCGAGPEGLLSAVEQVVHLTDLPLIVQPNAGLPKQFEGRNLYYCSPEYIATYAMRFVSLGVAAVGGCCGMTPEHIREIAAAIKPLSKGRARKTILKSVDPQVEEKPEVPLAHRSHWSEKIAQRKWVTTVELVPPRGYNLNETVEKAKQLSRFGIDAINIPDGPRASSRIAPIVVALKILQDAHIEPILHFCCRDRNLIGMQADLLGCAALGIHNFLFVTGDPPKLGLYPDATGVFDTDSIGMCSVQRRLNRGIDIGGQAVLPTTQGVIGVGLDPTALDRKRELARFRAKIEAGAEFAITQPVFDPNALLSFLDELGELPIPVIAGIWPLASYRNAEFMQNEVPGVVVPEVTMQRMQAVSKQPKEDQLAVGIDIAREMVDAVKSRVNGVQISAPFGRIDIAMSVLAAEPKA